MKKIGFFSLSCVDRDVVEPHQPLEAAGQGLFPAPDYKLWDKPELMVFFEDEDKKWREIEYDDIHVCLTPSLIIKWMNEWNAYGDGSSSVPKFQRTDTIEGSDVRVKLTG